MAVLCVFFSSFLSQLILLEPRLGIILWDVQKTPTLLRQSIKILMEFLQMLSFFRVILLTDILLRFKLFLLWYTNNCIITSLSGKRAANSLKFGVKWNISVALWVIRLGYKSQVNIHYLQDEYSACSRNLHFLNASKLNSWLSLT